MNATQIAQLLIPGVAISLSGWLTRTRCGNVEGGEDIPFRPPGWVFAVMWWTLFVTTGIAWALMPQTATANILIATIVALCCAWLPLYSCAKAKKEAAYILMATCILTWACVITTSHWTRYLIVLLGLWTTFATVLNFTEVAQLH